MSGTPIPTRAELVARVRALAPTLRERAVEAERQRRVSDGTARALRDAGLFRVIQPRAFGGYEHDPDVLAELVMEVAAACASTAWVFGVSAGEQLIAASFPLAAQAEMWAGNTDVITCGSFAPAGTAAAVPGGYRIGGVWSFVSGCDVASWAVLAAMLPPDAGAAGPLRQAFFLVPMAACEIDDNWFTVGLAATGSKNLVLRDAFVPTHRTLPVSAMMRCRSVAEAAHPHPLYRLPMLTCIPANFAAVAIGAAKGAIATFIDEARGRRTRGGMGGVTSALAEFVTVQLRVADALAAADAGETIVLRDLRAAIARLRQGEALSIADRVGFRRGHAFAARLALQAIDAIAAPTGVGGLAIDNAVHRAWRDITAVSRHISLSWDAVGTMTGQHALGLEPRSQY